MTKLGPQLGADVSKTSALEVQSPSIVQGVGISCELDQALNTSVTSVATVKANEASTWSKPVYCIRAAVDPKAQATDDYESELAFIDAENVFDCGRWRS